MKLEWFTVYLNGKKIDSIPVKAGTYGREEMRRSLVEHDGYDPAIVVRKERAKRPV